MQLFALEAVDQLWAGLEFKRTMVNFSDLEQGLSLVPGADEGPPELYLRVNGRKEHLPLSRIAAGQFGRLTGVRSSTYQEFVENDKLTNNMVRHSFSRPSRGGSVYVLHTKDQIIGVHLAEKPFVDPHQAWTALKAATDCQFGAMFITPHGAFEFFVSQGDPTASVMHGLYMLHDGRPKVGVHLSLHDRSNLVGTLKGAKVRKDQGKCETALESLISEKENEARGETEFVYNLAQDAVPDPARFLSRLSLLSNFSAQSSNHMLSGVADQLVVNSSHYDVVRYVANLATGGAPVSDRRYQMFAHFVATRGATVCRNCGYPQ